MWKASPPWAISSWDTPRRSQEAIMKARNVYWIIAAIAVAAVTIALAALIVVLAPSNSNAAAASVPQVLESRLEAMTESRHSAQVSSPASAVSRPWQPGPDAGDETR
jgi:hypothetical protein